MSAWQRPQVSLVRKKSAGMVPPVFVVADEGANGLDAPAPSSSMVAGGRTGFSMRCVSRHSASRAARSRGALRPAAAAATRATRTARVHPGVHSTARQRCTPQRTAPAVDTATWTCSSQAWSRVAPTAATASPSASPAVSSPIPAAAGRFPFHGRRHASRTSAPTSTRPSRGCRATVAKYQRDADGAATRWAAVSSRAMKPAAASPETRIVLHRNAGWAGGGLPVPGRGDAGVVVAAGRDRIRGGVNIVVTCVDGPAGTGFRRSGADRSMPGRSPCPPTGRLPSFRRQRVDAWTEPTSWGRLRRFGANGSTPGRADVLGPASSFRRKRVDAGGRPRSFADGEPGGRPEGSGAGW